MYRYKLWIRLDDFNTIDAYVHADSDWAAIQLGEAQYGKGNVLNWTRD